MFLQQYQEENGSVTDAFDVECFAAWMKTRRYVVVAKVGCDKVANAFATEADATWFAESINDCGGEVLGIESI